jgi:ureidoglycolate lyase
MASTILHVEQLTQAAFAPFGEVMTTEGAFDTVNDGTAQVFRDLAEIDVSARGGRTGFNIARAQPTPFPLHITQMEYHPLGSQAFWPLNGAEMLAIVAPAGAFDPAAMRAFYCPAGSGLNYKRGIWHHALIAIDRASEFVVIGRVGEGENYRTITVSEQVVIESPRPIN